MRIFQKYHQWKTARKTAYREKILKKKRMEAINPVYYLLLNNKKTPYTLTRVKTFRQKWFDLRNFSLTNRKHHGYLLANERGFHSLGCAEAVDVVFCNREKQIISLFSDFRTNDITSFQKKAFYCYVFRQGTIRYLKLKPRQTLRAVSRLQLRLRNY